MKKLEIIPIREFEHFDDEMLSLITAGTTVIGTSCNPNNCKINSGACNVNNCGTNEFPCDTNGCSINKKSIN